MDLRQLTYFCKIAEAGSFSAAARELNVAQPALSQQIGHLEAELGTALLLRSIRGTQLTGPGKTLYVHGQKILAQVRVAMEDVREEAAVPKGVVTLVLPPMLIRHVGPALIRRVLQDLPEVELWIREGLGLDAHEMIRKSRCDFGVIATAGPPDIAGAELLYREHLYFVRAADVTSPNRSVGTISFEEVLRHPIILSRERHGVRAIVEAVARKLRLHIDLTLETESSRLMLACVQQGLGTGILPWPSVCEQIVNGSLIVERIDTEHLTRDVSLIWAPNQPPSTGARAVADKLRDVIEQCRREDLIRGDADSRR